MKKIINKIDAAWAKLRKNTRTRKNLLFNRKNIETFYETNFSYPQTLFIECTNVCNARCVFCYYPKIADDLPRKYLSIDRFEKVITQYKLLAIHGGRIDLTPTVGDPLIDPYFGSRIDILRNAGLPVYFHTNLIHLNKKIEDCISNIREFDLHVTVSVAGFDKLAYQRLMGVDRFEDMKKNLETLSSITRNNNKVHLSVRMQDYYGSDYSKNIFERYLNKLGIPYSTDTYVDTWGGNVEQEINAVGMLEKRPWLNRVGPCKMSYSKPVVTVDFQLKLCDCRDISNELIVGNLDSQTLGEIWCGPKVHEIRESMYDTKLMPNICRKCELYISIYDHKK
jgi:radical SAM protein with 4Fe4S-binding SPASM domain